MQVLKRRTNYPRLEIPAATWMAVVGFAMIGIGFVWTTIAEYINRGNWSDLSSGWTLLFAGIYLPLAAAIAYKLRHPDRARPDGVWDEVGEKTQARVNAIFERRRSA